MESLIELLKSDMGIITICILNIILLVIGCINIFKITKLNKKYNGFMEKLGNGKNIEEDLENYMYQVNKVKQSNAEISGKIQEINNDLSNCIKRVGMVRYNAYQDTGSNLSFALALLDEHNNGVVLNGIYSREMSNIYAKPIKNGKSAYTFSDEEMEAIKQAMKKS